MSVELKGPQTQVVWMWNDVMQYPENEQNTYIFGYNFLDQSWIIYGDSVQ